MDPSLLKKYASIKKVPPPDSLFPPDFKLLEEERCPVHFVRLKWNREHTRAFCKRMGFKSHPISKKAIEGGNLNDYKEQRKSLLK